VFKINFYLMIFFSSVTFHITYQNTKTLRGTLSYLNYIVYSLLYCHYNGYNNVYFEKTEIPHQT